MCQSECTGVCVTSLSTRVCVTSMSTRVCVTSLSTGIGVTSLSTRVCVTSRSTRVCVTSLSTGIGVSTRVCVTSRSTGVYVTSLSTGVCVTSRSTGVCVTSRSIGVCVTSRSTGVCVTSLGTGVCASAECVRVPLNASQPALTITMFLSTDALSLGSWQALDSQEDPRLKQLADRLRNTVLKSKALATTKKYLGRLRRWKSWALDHKLQVFPARECHVVLYLEYLSKTKVTKAPIEEAVNALAWAHSLSGLLSPTTSPLCKQCWMA